MNQVKKILHRLENTDASNSLKFDNLDELISDSLSNSQKPIKNEQEFYQQLFTMGAYDFVKNKFKIKKYLSNLWNII